MGRIGIGLPRGVGVAHAARVTAAAAYEAAGAARRTGQDSHRKTTASGAPKMATAIRASAKFSIWFPPFCNRHSE